MNTVLILEDELRLSMYWKTELEQAGFRVLRTARVEEAIALLASERVDLVVTDMLIKEGGQLRPSGGLSLLTHIRLSLPTKPKTIAVSGADPQSNVLKHAQVLRADRCLSKPVTGDELVATVRELLGEAGEDAPGPASTDPK